MVVKSKPKIRLCQCRPCPRTAYHVESGLPVGIAGHDFNRKTFPTALLPELLRLAQVGGKPFCLEVGLPYGRLIGCALPRAWEARHKSDVSLNNKNFLRISFSSLCKNHAHNWPSNDSHSRCIALGTPLRQPRIQIIRHPTTKATTAQDICLACAKSGFMLLCLRQPIEIPFALQLHFQLLRVMVFAFNQMTLIRGLPIHRWDRITLVYRGPVL